VAQGRVEADPGYGAEPWHGVAEALRREAEAWRRERMRVSVVLSNHFVRYALVPQAGAVNREEEVALARFQFARIHGDRAKSWEVRLSPEVRGDRLGCAVDRELVESLKACFPRSGKARLHSVQPHLMAAFNRWRGRIPRSGAWLLLAEADRVCLALLSAKGWRGLYNTRGGAAGPKEWAELIARERHRAGADMVPEVVLVRPASRPDLLGLDDAPEMLALSA
jgi:hypothetical protein